MLFFWSNPQKLKRSLSCMSPSILLKVLPSFCFFEQEGQIWRSTNWIRFEISAQIFKKKIRFCALIFRFIELRKKERFILEHYFIFANQPFLGNSSLVCTSRYFHQQFWRQRWCLRIWTFSLLWYLQRTTRPKIMSIYKNIRILGTNEVISFDPKIFIE